MKNKVMVTIFCLAVVLCFTGCSTASINVFNWGDYIDEDVLKIFRKETGIKVIYDTFATNEEMYAKIKSGGSDYDILFPSDYMIERMINEDMLEKLNFDNIPNMANTDARFRNLAYDAQEAYSVPYMWGTVGILYNTTKVQETVDSWDILWDPAYANNIFMYSSLRDTIGVALIREGYSSNSMNIDELNAAKNALIQQKPLVRAYLDDAVKDSMIGGEGALALVYSGDAIYCMEENDELDYAVPKEGSNVFYDAMVIPKGSKNKENAEKFINFMCRPDIALLNTEYIGYSTTNAAAFAMLDEEWQNNPHYWTPDDIFYNCEAYRDLGYFLAEYNKAWTEVLASR